MCVTLLQGYVEVYSFREVFYIVFEILNSTVPRLPCNLALYCGVWGVP